MVSEEDPNQIPPSKAPVAAIQIDKEDPDQIPPSKAPVDVIVVEEEDSKQRSQPEESISDESRFIIDTAKLNVSGIAFKLDKLWKECAHYRGELLKRTDEI